MANKSDEVRREKKRVTVASHLDISAEPYEKMFDDEER